MYEPTPLWCVYLADLSKVVLFEGELPALRYAVNHSMLAKRVDIGVDLITQLNNTTPPADPLAVIPPDEGEPSSDQ